MIATAAILLLFFLPSVSCQATEVGPWTGAWLETNLRRTSAPADVNPDLRTAPARILYLGRDQTFALIDATVNSVANKYTVISDGDGIVVHVGRWEEKDGSLTASYRVASRTIDHPHKPLPGPPASAVIGESGEALTFQGKLFHRAPELDDKARSLIVSAEGTLKNRGRR